jgi:hypothetical protein
MLSRAPRGRQMADSIEEPGRGRLLRIAGDFRSVTPVTRLAEKVPFVDGQGMACDSENQGSSRLREATSNSPWFHSCS